MPNLCQICGKPFVDESPFFDGKQIVHIACHKKPSAKLLTYQLIQKVERLVPSKNRDGILRDLNEIFQVLESTS